jgi:hypothetical protein
MERRGLPFFFLWVITMLCYKEARIATKGTPNFAKELVQN